MPEIKISDVKIHDSWKSVLKQEFESQYFTDLKTFIVGEKKKYRIYPPSAQIFSAFDLCPFEDVKVVILGQDPYHGYGQAHGLCFSVLAGVDFPPSLKNIFKELHNDIGILPPLTGDLTPWAKQGVLLLNATLTVRAETAGSHQNKGWETFTDKVIEILSVKKQHLVFILWGNYARAKKALIDTSKHYVLEAAHPSPLSASRGFFGCRHFSACNEWLKKNKLTPVHWNL
jgi:uracil-DNA glycosylase